MKICNASNPMKIAIPKYIKKLNLFLDFSRRSNISWQLSSPHIEGSLSSEMGFQQTEQCLCGSTPTLDRDLLPLFDAAA